MLSLSTISMPINQQPVCNDDICPNCKIYKKYPGQDFCCLACISTAGGKHSRLCHRIPIN